MTSSHSDECSVSSQAPGREFYIVDLRRSFIIGPYVTLWCPDNAGYAYPLPWAGRYSADQVRRGGSYYRQTNGRSLTRFAVPCEYADRFGVPPAESLIDGDTGPVILNTADVRRKLRKAATNTSEESDSE